MSNALIRSGADFAPTLLPVASPALPARTRSALDPNVVREIARSLFEAADPTLPSSHLQVSTRDIPHVYVSAHRALELRLFHALTNNERLFLRAAVGTGASTFIADYARAFNLRCRDRGDPRRVAYLSIMKGTTSERRLLEALCFAVQAPLTNSERRTSSPLELAQRIAAQAQRLRLVAIVLDHVHKANDDVLSVIADLMYATDPNYQVPFEFDDAPPPTRLGIVLVDHLAPQTLFANHTDVLALLQGNSVEMSPISSPESVAELIRQSDIGMEDFELSEAEDAEFAKTVLDTTNGLMANIAGLLRLVDLISRAQGGCRPDMAILKAALPYHHKMIRTLHARNGASHTISTGRPRKATRSRSAGSGKSGGRAGRPSAAEAEHRDMQRKRNFVVLPEDKP